MSQPRRRSRSSNFDPSLPCPPACPCVLIGSWRLAGSQRSDSNCQCLSVWPRLDSVSWAVFEGKGLTNGCFTIFRQLAQLQKKTFTKPHFTIFLHACTCRLNNDVDFAKLSSIMGSRILNPLCSNLHCPPVWLVSLGELFEVQWLLGNLCHRQPHCSGMDGWMDGWKGRSRHTIISAIHITLLHTV